MQSEAPTLRGYRLFVSRYYSDKKGFFLGWPEAWASESGFRDVETNSEGARPRFMRRWIWRARDLESIKVKNVHVLGNSIQIAPAMPKSGHMANSHAKVCASAIVALLSGQPVNPAPVTNNTCYSFITDRDVVHVASVHQYDRDKKTFIAVQGAGGLSPTWTPLEGEYALTWAEHLGGHAGVRSA